MNKYIISKDKIEFLDSRFYKIGDEYVPSVTTITSNYPKGASFSKWLMDKGAEAEVIRDTAADIGSNVHQGIENMLNGIELNHEHYQIPEWEMISKAHEFFTNHKFTNIQAEANYVSKQLGYGGTIDFIGTYKGERWLIDFKTSNSVQRSHELQLWAYKKLYEKMSKNKVDRIGVLHLKSATRTEKEFQGIGYQLKEVKQDDWIDRVFESVKVVFEDHMKGLKPRIKNYKLKLKL